MKKNSWFSYPASITAPLQGERLHGLTIGNYTRLSAIAAALAVYVILHNWIHSGSPEQMTRWFVALAALGLSVIVFLARSIPQGKTIWPQRVAQVLITWAIVGVVWALAPAQDTKATVWPVFLLGLLACAALTTRPLFDQLLNLLGSILGSALYLFSTGSLTGTASLFLAAGGAAILGLYLSSLNLSAKAREIELQQLALTLRRQLDDLTLRDPVTSLYNEPAFKTRLSVETARSIRYKHPLCLLAFELQENGQEIASSGSPEHGEMIVAGLAEAMNKTLRTTDILGRGQDGRFLVALPDTELANARIAATRIQATLARFNAEKNLSITMNCGISQHHGEAIESLLLVTEARMREAVQLGPDQIVVE